MMMHDLLFATLTSIVHLVAVKDVRQVQHFQYRVMVLTRLSHKFPLAHQRHAVVIFVFFL